VKKLLLIVLSVLVPVPMPAQSQRNGFEFRSARMIAMGGAGVALPGPDNAVFLNPALLGLSEHTQIRLLEAQVLVNENTFRQYSFYEDHQDQFEDLDQMTDPDRNRFYNEMLEVARDETVFGLNGSAPLSIIGRGYSFGVYERAVINYELREGASSIPLMHVDAVAGGQVVVGIGRKILTFMFGDLYFGANGKYLYRAVVSETKSAPAVDTIENARVYRGWAMAFDMGLAVVSGNWSVGAGFYDFNWPEIRWTASEDPADGFHTPDGTIGGSMRIGAAFQPDFSVPGLFDRFKFAFDVESPLSDRMGTLKKVSMGSEARFAGLLMIRAGIHQGYPAAGIGVRFKVVKLEYAFTGEALGRHPGQLDSWNHYVSVGLGWNI
jgi:hypothetical protein